MIWETFLPHLFFGNSKYLSPIVGDLSTTTVNKSSLGLLNPVTSANKKYLSLQCASTKFIRAVTGEGTFSNSYHLLALKE